jgi:hypothetical protein
MWSSDAMPMGIASIDIIAQMPAATNTLGRQCPSLHPPGLAPRDDGSAQSI